MKNPLISIVSPVYSAEKIIDELVKRIVENVEKITQDYEILLVDDCGPDQSWQKILENGHKNPKVKGIKLSKNFGQHFAITAGIDHAIGDYIIVMDCDLQDDPIYITTLYEKALEGNDIVYTIKSKRKHSFLKNIFASIYNSIFNYLTDYSFNSSINVGAYSLITRKVANAFKTYGDYHRHYLSILRWLGFNSCYIYIEHLERFEGKSSYTFSKLITHAVNGITSQSDKLLRLFVSLGLFVSSVSFLSILLIILMYFINGFKSGWASTIVIILLSTGLILTGIGILGIYVGKTFNQTKNRPKYIVNEVINMNP